MKTIYLFPLLLLAGACSSSSDKTPAPDTVAAESAGPTKPIKNARTTGSPKPEEQVMIDAALQHIRQDDGSPSGFWVGAFGQNKINVVIADVSGDSAKGYTICAGNFRAIRGTCKKTGDKTFAFDMNEPGDNKYDGHFNFIINTNDRTMTGDWHPFQKEATEPKEFILYRTKYVYDPSVGKYPEASSRLLTNEDVENRLPEELTMMRNEIYARHGYSFHKKNIRAAFDSAAWYVPMGVDIRDSLTDTEVKNIALITSYEHYYEEEYDEYGR